MRLWTGSGRRSGNMRHTLTHFASRARSHGEQTFVILGEDRITYAAWFRAAAALARHLEAQGAAPGDRVALAMCNLPEWPVTCFAVAAVGAVVVPLNAWWTGDELAFALDDCGARVLLCDGERYDRLAARTGALAPIEHCLGARATPDTTPSTRLASIMRATSAHANMPGSSTSGLMPSNLGAPSTARIRFAAPKHQSSTRPPAICGRSRFCWAIRRSRTLFAILASTLKMP